MCTRADGTPQAVHVKAAFDSLIGRPRLERPALGKEIVVEGHVFSQVEVAGQLARARSIPGVTHFFGPAALGRMSKSKIAVGM